MIGTRAIRRIFLLAPLWLACAAIAQVEPEAATRLEGARQAHGGEALQNLETYREVGVVTIYGPAGEPVAQLRGVTLAELEGEAYRDELYAGNELTTISQVTSEGAWTWTPDTGVLRVPPAQAEELRSALYRGLFGMRFGGERDAAEVLGTQSWRNVEGTAVRVTTHGVETTYLLSEDGHMLAQRYSSPQLGELTVLFDDFRERRGVRVPFVVQYYAGDTVILQTEMQEIEPNVVLPADAFEAPADAEF